MGNFELEDRGDMALIGGAIEHIETLLSNNTESLNITLNLKLTKLVEKIESLKKILQHKGIELDLTKIEELVSRSH